MLSNGCSSSTGEACSCKRYGCPLFRDSLSQAHVGVFTSTQDGRFVFANPAMALMLGYDSPEMMLSLVSDIAAQVYWNPSDRMETIRQLELHGELLNFECRFRRRDGAMIWVANSVRKMPSGEGEALYQGFVTDITARKEAEVRLQQSEQRYRELVENISDVIYDVGLDGKIRYLSPSARNVFRDADALVGLSFMELVDPRDRMRVSGIWKDILEGRLRSNEYRLSLGPEKTVWVRTMSRPAYHEGQMVGIVGVLQDITERKQSEAAIASANARLEALWNVASKDDADMTQICSGISSNLARMTGSTLAFYGHVEEADSELTIMAWAGEADTLCMMSDKPCRFSFDDAGVWVEAVRSRVPFILNDYAAHHPAKHGLPHGHVPLTNLLVVPYLWQGRVVALAAVANRSEDYTAADADQVSLFMHSVQPIVTRKQAEEALRESEERYRGLSSMLRMICDNVPDMIWAKSLDKTYIFANKALCSGLLGAVDVEEPLGRTDLYFAERERASHPADASWHTFGEICRDTDQITMDAGCQQQFDEYGNVQGSFLFLDVRKAPLIDGNGRMIGTVGSARDITEYRRIQDALEEREERFRIISLTTSDLVYSCVHEPGTGYCVDWVGGAAQQITGYTADELKSQMPFGSMVTALDRETFADNVTGLEPDASATCELRIMRKDGTVIWVESTAKCVVETVHGRGRRLYGSLTDITARKRTENALRISEFQHRVIFENAPLGMMLFDSQGNIVDCNEPSAPLMGVPRESLLGHNMARRGGAGLRKALEKALSGTVGVFEGVPDTAGGSVSSTLRMIFNPISSQTPTGVIATVEDISVRRRMEEAVQQERAILRDILEDTLAGYWDWDFSSGSDYLSPTFKRMFGYEDHELANTSETWKHLILPEDLPGVLENIDSHISSRGGVPFNMEVRFRHKAGHVVWVICAGRVIRWDEDGRPLRMVGCHIDITGRKEIEEALVLAKQEADDASKIKSEFLANMSHEIRTPLNGVMGMLQLLELSGLTDEQREYTGTGMQSCRRLVSLLTDILDLSRIEAGVLRIQNGPVDLGEAMRHTRDLFASMAREQGLSLDFDMDPVIPRRLLGDTLRVQQVLTNLVGNALKFTSTGGVTVDASLLPAAVNGECHVLFSVTDTGIGIPDDKLALLFQPFSQVNSGYTRTYQGAGLGLSICKRLVGLMGGSMTVVSEENAGTTFYFTVKFGLEAPAEAEAPQPRPVQPGELAGLRVLLVEDDHVSGITGSAMLRKFGVAVEHAGDGFQALDALRRSDFDLVLMDVQMPGMDGIEATRAIRAGEAGSGVRKIPIVAMTAYAMGGDREKCLAAGMDRYVSKPFVMDDLMLAIVEACGRK